MGLVTLLRPQHITHSVQHMPTHLRTHVHLHTLTGARLQPPPPDPFPSSYQPSTLVTAACVRVALGT